MSLQDIAFLLSRSFSTIGESFRTITCPTTVVGGKQGHAACEILHSNKAFLVLVEFHGDQ